MRKYIANNKQAVIVLHEIYGINQYIKDVCGHFAENGFDVYCPCLIHSKYFSYEDSDKAYSLFMNKCGFDVWKDIDELVIKLKTRYKRVIVFGSSAGATIAWRCSATGNADGIVCCYGSRIRDYTSITPLCQTLLIFARNDSFDVDNLVSQITNKENISTVIYDAHHGFMDQYGEYYSSDCCRQAVVTIKEFVNVLED